jgi:hypothetical protein
MLPKNAQDIIIRNNLLVNKLYVSDIVYRAPLPLKTIKKVLKIIFISREKFKLLI